MLSLRENFKRQMKNFFYISVIFVLISCCACKSRYAVSNANMFNEFWAFERECSKDSVFTFQKIYHSADTVTVFFKHHNRPVPSWQPELSNWEMEQKSDSGWVKIRRPVNCVFVPDSIENDRFKFPSSNVISGEYRMSVREMMYRPLPTRSMIWESRTFYTEPFNIVK